MQCQFYGRKGIVIFANYLLRKVENLKDAILRKNLGAIGYEI